MSVDPPATASPVGVLVTRPPPGGQELAALLEAAGFQAHLFPMLEVRPPEDASALRHAAARAAAGSYDWIALTSANGVRAFSDALAEARGGQREGPPARLAVVGAATAAAAAREGWSVDLVTERYTAEGLVEAFARFPVEGKRVLLPVAEAARSTLPEGLRARRAEVDVVVAYRTVVPRSDDVERLRALLRGGALAVATLASPSAAEGLLEVLGTDALAVPVAAIGPVTAEAAEALGFRVVAVAQPHTADGLVESVLAWTGAA
jgi:uroporphyrinogen III methyltransferase / synthase